MSVLDVVTIIAIVSGYHVVDYLEEDEVPRD